MNKKNRTITLIVVVVFLAMIFLLMLFNRLYDNFLLKGFRGESFTTVNEYDLANMDSIDFSQEDVILIPKIINPDLEAQRSVVDVGLVNNDVIAPAPMEQQDFRPVGESAQQQEQFIQIGTNEFLPREVGAVFPARVTLTFEVLDNNNHEVVFTDDLLSYLSFSISKSDGIITKSFISPEPGVYNFYINNPENQGIFRVEER